MVRLVRRLSYGFFALAMVFALLMVWQGERAQDNAAASGIFAICLGLGVILRAWSGYAAGRIEIRRSTAERDDRPLAFWTVVVLLTVVGVMLGAAGLMRLFGVL